MELEKIDGLVDYQNERNKETERERERERERECSVPDTCEFGPWKWKSQDL